MHSTSAHASISHDQPQLPLSQEEPLSQQLVPAAIAPSTYNEAGGYGSSQRLPPKTLNIADSLVTNERKEYQLSLSYKSQRNIGGRFDHAGDPWMFVKDLWMLLFCGWSGMLQINFAVSKCISRE
uniref:Uncharacterized protein n=1 Tax=Salix viminalis TaxID=40686 RepID=A0A6N2KBE0_SALVM